VADSTNQSFDVRKTMLLDCLRLENILKILGIKLCLNFAKLAIPIADKNFIFKGKTLRKTCFQILTFSRLLKT